MDFDEKDCFGNVMSCTFYDKNFATKFLEKPRATQIGSRAKILLNSHVEGQSIRYFYRFSQFFYEIAIFQKLWKGRTRELKGPQVAHGCFRTSLSNLAPKLKFAEYRQGMQGILE
jgi:hypothetical protein